MNYFSYRKELYKLNKARDKENIRLSKLAKEAELSGGRIKAHELYESERFPLQMIDEDIAVLQTEYLRTKVSKTIYSMPSVDEFSGMWERGHSIGEWHLTDKGLVEVHSTIRKEKKERRENISFWVSILFGLMGLIIGLISVIKN